MCVIQEYIPPGLALSWKHAPGCLLFIYIHAPQRLMWNILMSTAKLTKWDKLYLIIHLIITYLWVAEISQVLLQWPPSVTRLQLNISGNYSEHQLLLNESICPLEQLQLCNAYGFPLISFSLQVFLQHFCQDEMRTLTWSFIGRLLCFRSLSCSMTHFLLRFIWQTDVVTNSLRMYWQNSEFIVP